MLILVAVVLMSAINDGVGHETLQSKQIQFGSKREKTEKKKKKPNETGADKIRS